MILTTHFKMITYVSKHIDVSISLYMYIYMYTNLFINQVGDYFQDPCTCQLMIPMIGTWKIFIVCFTCMASVSFAGVASVFMTCTYLVVRFYNEDVLLKMSVVSFHSKVPHI